CAREDAMERMAVTESAAADWTRRHRSSYSAELRAFYEEHEQHMEPIVEWVKTSGDLKPTGTPTGEDVTEAIRQKARELGYGEVGFTRNDRQDRKSTRLNSSHQIISYAVFCLKKKTH